MSLPDVTVSDLDVVERIGETTSRPVTVSLSETSGARVEVSYETHEASATAPEDYDPRSGRLIFEPGQSTKTVYLTVTGDNQAEGDEELQFRVSDAINADVVRSAGTVTISDPAPQVSIADEWVSESDGSVAFEITLTTPSVTTVNVPYATGDGSASSGTDYTSRTGTASFAPGETRKVVTVQIADDGVDESTETMYLRLTEPAGPASLQRTSAKATISDSSARPTMYVANASVAEGWSGTRNCWIPVRLSNLSQLRPTATWRTSNGSATSGSDYTSSSGTVTFYSTSTAQNILVPVHGDQTREGNETFTVTISNLTNASGGTTTATCTITNDD
jgi:chitinase